jgi:hypothetical protein
MIGAESKPARDRPTFTVRLRAEPGVDPIRAMRALLKAALRRFGLRAISAEEDNNDQREKPEG